MGYNILKIVMLGATVVPSGYLHSHISYFMLMDLVLLLICLLEKKEFKMTLDFKNSLLYSISPFQIE